MPMPNLSSVSVDALLKLRDDVEKALSRRANVLQDQAFEAGRCTWVGKAGRGSLLKGRSGGATAHAARRKRWGVDATITIRRRWTALARSG